MPDPATATVFLYWIAISTFSGSIWNAFQIWERCRDECRPPEVTETWDGNARLMLENVHEAAINDQRLDIALATLENVEEVIMREDSHGQKMVYYPKKQFERIARQVRKGLVGDAPHSRGDAPHSSSNNKTPLETSSFTTSSSYSDVEFSD